VIQSPLISRGATIATYRILWLVAILLVFAMPVVIIARRDVWLGPATFDDAHPLTHPLIVVGGDVVIRSGVVYPLVVLTGNLLVDGRVQDDLVVVGGNVSLTDRTVVDGDLVAIVGQISRAPGSQVRGLLGGRIVESADGPAYPAIETVDLMSQVRLGLATGLGLLLLCLVVAAALPWSVVVTAATARRYPIRSALAALTAVVVIPLLLLPLVLSLVGLPVAIVLSFGALGVWLVGLTAAGYLVGRKILRWRAQSPGYLTALIVGLAPILLVLAVPLIGPIVVGSIGILCGGARIVSFVETDRASDAMTSIAGAAW
jgi:hypothetical protein